MKRWILATLVVAPLLGAVSLLTPREAVCEDCLPPNSVCETRDTVGKWTRVGYCCNGYFCDRDGNYGATCISTEYKPKN